MAEVAGLVVGVVGLAGLIGAFKDVIDLFNDFADSRELGRDYEILDAKIDIERTILLQWVDQVHLLRSNYDQRLDDAATQHAVARILACIRNLLSDEAELKARFGVGEANKRHDSPEYDRRHMMSSHRLGKFIEEFNALNLRANMRNQNVSLRKRVRWIIRDKKKFENLVKELAHFVTKLNEIMPTNDGVSMTDEDIDTIRSLKELKTLMAASLGQRKVVADSTRRVIERACEERILQLLWFRTMNDRQESIAPAHDKTLHWALEPPEDEYPWDDLSEWLRGSAGIYWVSGKAGSGKSTLMKHLFQHERTRSLLSRWAGGKNLSIFQFFFYNLGTALQKSQEGLSRALLYQILSKHRSLIADSLPNMWKQFCETDDYMNLPSVAETKYAFQVIAKSSTKIGKFCFFIDGLDEFVGNYLDGIAFIQQLAANDNIKILASSRPIPDCVVSFEGLPTLQLHHLTQADIRSYVQDVIGGHKYMQRLTLRNPEEAKKIMEDVVTKSSGVFLWVILACRSLIHGFSHYDRISELRKRVDELPPELEEMFEHMLSRVDKRNQEQGARLLRLCYTYNTLGTPACAMSTLGVSLFDDESLDARHVQKLTNEQKRELCEETEGRLRSRCGGLLELARSTCFCEEKGGEHDPKVDSGVVFMHRTVFEFLNSARVWELNCLQLPPGLDSTADMSLLQLNLSILSLPTNPHQAVRFLRESILWGSRSDRDNPEGRTNIFWILQDVLEDLSSSLPKTGFFNSLWVMHLHNREPGQSHVALNLAVEAGAVNFVKTHIGTSQRRKAMVPSCGCQPLLYHAVVLPLMNGKVRKWLQGDNRLGFLTAKMASLLLSSGNHPNQPIQDEETGLTTPWVAWQDEMTQKTLDDSAKLEVIRITEFFLDAGAAITDATEDWLGQVLGKILDPQILKKKEELLQLVTRLREGGKSSDHGNEVKRSADENLGGCSKRTRV